MHKVKVRVNEGIMRAVDEDEIYGGWDSRKPVVKM